MNPNPTRTLWISIGSALFAVFFVYSYSQGKKQEYDDKFGTMKQVLIAKKDILEMSDIDDTMIDIVEKPADFVEPGALSNPEEVISLVAAVPIKKGEQIISTKILKPGPNTGLALQVAPTRRAVTIPVDEFRGVAKLIRPGDRIDLLAVVEQGKGLDKSFNVKTILQDVSVLATGVRITNNIPRKLDDDGKSYTNLNTYTDFSSITVELDPQKAQEIIFLMATNPGSLYMTLRNPNDRTKQSLSMTTQQSVQGYANIKRNVAPVRRPTSVVTKKQVTPKPTPKKKSRNNGPFREIN
ncbi:MAG: Flp pilus assembly protein CpaB [Bdellovibrionota bacterium]|nr:Flp pilus assembly protein CpaB [Bdellovibrionota bacterium]